MFCRKIKHINKKQSLFKQNRERKAKMLLSVLCFASHFCLSMKFLLSFCLPYELKICIFYRSDLESEKFTKYLITHKLRISRFDFPIFSATFCLFMKSPRRGRILISFVFYNIRNIWSLRNEKN